VLLTHAGVRDASAALARAFGVESWADIPRRSDSMSAEEVVGVFTLAITDAEAREQEFTADPVPELVAV
jgi:hypothetical protein